MAKQTFFWTVLPNGFSEDGQSLRLSLLLSPRLVPDSNPRELKDFPDLVDWPATIRQSRFTLTFGARSVSVAGNDFAGATRIDDRLGLADSTVWSALFPETTLVIGFEWRDLTNHSVLSFPAAEIDKLVQNLYGDLAASAGDQLPDVTTLLTNPKWTNLLDAVQSVDQAFTHERTGRRLIDRQFAAFKNRAFDPLKDPDRNPVEAIFRQLARFQLFHTPPSKPKSDKYEGVTRPDAKAYAEWQGYEQTELPSPDDFKDIYDFHKIAGAMNQYPTLLRKLGLVIDVLISRDAFDPSPDALLFASVTLPGERPERQPDASPRTHALLDANRFQAVPRKPASALRIADGLLDLDPKTFSLLQSDVDGSAMKVMNFARSLLLLREKADQKIDPVTRHERELGAPALRNAGLMLVQANRDDALSTAIETQHDFNDNANATPPKPSEMVAEDLVRGYRIDIWDDVSKRWHSLCERAATYDLADGAAIVDVAREEGTVKLAATTSPDKTNNADIIWLHEALVTWAGWSLCAPPPGKTIHHRATIKDKKGKEVVVHDDHVDDPEAEVPPELRLQTVFKSLPGTLPRLRYGRRYWIRARAVDLAGNSLELQRRDFGPEQSRDNAILYQRYEPISAPALALLKNEGGATHRPEEGESMERLAIRSFNDTPSLNSVTATQRAYRIAVPPRTTQREAEQHGMLDRAGKVDPSFFAMLAAKDNSLAEEKIMSAGPIDGAPVETRYTVMVDGEELPYLPDPLAVKIAARLIDHPTFPSEKIITIPFYDEGASWPDASPFKIEIYEDAADTPHFDVASRTLLVPLPKAARVTLRLSAETSSEALRLLALWNLLTPAQINQLVTVGREKMTLERMAHFGQHWMFTPWRNVELVHAVQRPLMTPEFVRLEVFRFLEDTFATPRFISTCSIPSTDRLDLRASWSEPRDDVVKDVLENVPRLDHAFAIKITDEKSYVEELHEYRPVNGKPDEVEINGDRALQVGTRKVHEFHDTRYRRVKYWLEATTKFREYLPASLLTQTVDEEIKPTEEHIKVTGAEEIRWIESSAPPPAPEILYVVPTFGWVRSQTETQQSSLRRGGGLRVYLNRPWNATGYGEMLAVVLPPANFNGDPDLEPEKLPYKKFITQWGNDPIWLSPFVPGLAPKLNNFPLARVNPDPDGKWLPSFAPIEETDQRPGPFPTTGLVPPEFPSGPVFVDIAPHDVFYDDERKLCYCDIEVTWGASYYPFIRLALARYQPTSVSTAHLSSIVFADFMPLVPDRWLNVMRTNDARIRRVRVFGNTYSDSSAHHEANANRRSVRVAASSVVEVWVEKFDPSRGEDFGWSREAHATVQRDGTAVAGPPLTTMKVRATELLRQREFAALIEENIIDRVFLAPVLWQGQITLPDSTDPSARYRLVIAEYEEYLVDDDAPYNPPVTQKDRRLVFVEHVTLD
jgi:hypothetical protein